MPAMPTLSWKPLAAIAASAVALLVVMAVLLKLLDILSASKVAMFSFAKALPALKRL